MGWLQETTAQWLRILTVTGDRSMSMEEKTRLIAEVNGPVRLAVKLQPYRWRWQRTIAAEALDAAGAAALDTLNRHLLAAMVTTEDLLARLAAATGKTREQILQEMSIHVQRQITAAEEADGEP